jgi:hypothetical protein
MIDIDRSTINLIFGIFLILFGMIFMGLLLILSGISDYRGKQITGISFLGVITLLICCFLYAGIKLIFQ